jgi:hypothetical protein
MQAKVAHFGLKNNIQKVHWSFFSNSNDGQIWYYFDVVFLLKNHALLKALDLCFSKKISQINLKIELEMDIMIFKHFHID